MNFVQELKQIVKVTREGKMWPIMSRHMFFSDFSLIECDRRPLLLCFAFCVLCVACGVGFSASCELRVASCELQVAAELESSLFLKRPLERHIGPGVTAWQRSCLICWCIKLNNCNDWNNCTERKDIHCAHQSRGEKRTFFSPDKQTSGTIWPCFERRVYSPFNAQVALSSVKMFICKLRRGRRVHANSSRSEGMNWLVVPCTSKFYWWKK